MLTLPDFKEKKILFISHFDDDLPSDLKFRNGNICLYKNGEFMNQISCHLVFTIFIIGSTTLTSHLIRKAAEYGISMFLLNNSFRPYAEIMSKAEGNYLLRQSQYTVPKKQVLFISKQIVKNKVENQYKLLKSYKKSIAIKSVVKKIEITTSLDTLLGLEGSVSSKYFKQVFKDIGWYRRAPRTKEDIPNLLLDIGYTFLFNYVDALLRLFGFDTYKGFYHQLFFQRRSLSCDVMEPMRTIIDKQLVKSYNLGQINEKDFSFKNGSFKYKKKKSYTYVDIWFQKIMDKRRSIYKYIHGFYQYVMNPEKYKFPYYKSI
jgi:CRISPR-associated protein Cas1